MATDAAVAAASSPPAKAASTRYPPQAFFVIFTEGAERMSFYGLTAILTTHMSEHLGFSEANAVALFSIFSAVTYIAPLLGGWLADRFLGRYRTILFVSFGYVLGHVVLSAFENRFGLYLGCALIAMGAGGIKPNVSVFMGDQFRKDQEHMLERAYGWFYFSINVGSAIGITACSEVYERKQTALAFLIPAIAMGIALVIYYLGRNRYTRVPPTGPNPNGFFAVLGHLFSVTPQPGQSRLEAAGAKFPPQSITGVRAVYRIGFVFLFISAFWALFFQYGGSWQIQASKMNRELFGWSMGAGFYSNLNTVFVLSLIPIMNAVYKRRADAGHALTPIRKMTIGMFIAPLAFLAAWALQNRLDAALAAGQTAPHAMLQAVQYFFLSLAEVLISITGLEFAFTQAPKEMKGVVMGMWFLCISLGAQLTALVAKAFSLVAGDPINWQSFFLVFFGISVAAAVGFSFVGKWYRPAHVEAAP
ncbi:MAG: MFS transporter [Archangiaceae bacterium]|nr:MFS transporter [Archangiaceae bacterium]